jgi:catalase
LPSNKFEICVRKATLAAFGAGIHLPRKARFDQPLADSQQVMTSVDVVSTTDAEDSVPEHFFGDFASALAKHRAWDRETGFVPA